MYQIPVASFAAPNALENRNGTLFAETEGSGGAEISAPGDKGTGQLVSGVYEGSNVDLQTEFTNIILAQKAYSTAATVFRTSDEMFQQAAGMKR
ncbi:MAG: flgE [Rhodospirillaceae bacterium]|nr:MAG: flgE [Rhodospirillaceae bacterium]